MSHDPLKEYVKTFVLSNILRSLWLWVPRLELIPETFPDLETIFDSSRVSRVNKLELCLDRFGNNVDACATYLIHTSWINAPIKRRIQ